MRVKPIYNRFNQSTILKDHICKECGHPVLIGDNLARCSNFDCVNAKEATRIPTYSNDSNNWIYNYVYDNDFIIINSPKFIKNKATSMFYILSKFNSDVQVRFCDPRTRNSYNLQSISSDDNKTILELVDFDVTAFTTTVGSTIKALKDIYPVDDDMTTYGNSIYVSAPDIDMSLTHIGINRVTIYSTLSHPYIVFDLKRYR